MNRGIGLAGGRWPPPVWRWLEVSFIDDSPRTVSVRAGEDAMVRAWDKRTLSAALSFNPQMLAKFAVAMTELLVERLRDTARRVCSRVLDRVLRCPSCDRYLGRGINPRFCPRCGFRLRE